MRILELKNQGENSRGLKGSNAQRLILRLMKIEVQLADCIARSSQLDSPDSGMRMFYTRVVDQRKAVETAMTTKEAR